jgi:hypothetical protein
MEKWKNGKMEKRKIAHARNYHFLLTGRTELPLKR